jgi:hypothetical protein
MCYTSATAHLSPFLSFPFTCIRCTDHHSIVTLALYGPGAVVGASDLCLCGRKMRRRQSTMAAVCAGCKLAVGPTQQVGQPPPIEVTLAPDGMTYTIATGTGSQSPGGDTAAGGGAVPIPGTPLGDGTSPGSLAGASHMSVLVVHPRLFFPYP